MTSFTSLLFVFLGGGMGAVARQVMDYNLTAKMGWESAPWGIL